MDRKLVGFHNMIPHQRYEIHMKLRLLCIFRSCDFDAHTPLQYTAQLELDRKPNNKLRGNSINNIFHLCDFFLVNSVRYLDKLI